MDPNDSINEAPDIKPIELPKRSRNPSLDERIGRVESVLNIND